MPEVSLSYRPSEEKRWVLGGAINSLPEPPPFDLDGLVNDLVFRTPGGNADTKDGIAATLWPMVRPFAAQGYNAMSAMNRGFATFVAHIDGILEFMADKRQGGKGISLSAIAGPALKSIADYYDSDSQRWAKRAKEVGINFFDELISEAIGGGPYGVGEFMLGVPYATLLGAARAEKKGENPLVGALVEGAKRYSLGHIFRAMEPMRRYLKTPVMGGVFGVQTAAEGGEPSDIAKAIGTGMMYSLASPGGIMGLNEIRRQLKIQYPKLMSEVGAVGKDIDAIKNDPRVDKIVEKKQRLSEKKEEGLTEGLPTIPKEAGESPRSWWETVEDAARTDPILKDKMAEIQAEEPVVNIVQPNRMNLEKAYKTVDMMGEDKSLLHARESTELTPVEKGAIYQVLMEKSQHTGNWDGFIKVMDEYSLYLVDLGRGVQIASVWGKSTPMGFIKWAEAQLEKVNSKYGWFDTILGRKKAFLTAEEKAQIAQDFVAINKMPDGIEKSNEMLKLIDDIAVKVPPSVSELIDAYRYTNMLSSPQTQERNILPNMTATFIERPFELALKGGIDYVQSGLRGVDRQAYISDVPIYYKNAINSIPNALVAFKAAWNMEYSDLTQKPDIGIEMKTQFEQARAKQIPKVLTVVQRFMEASDKFNSMLIASGESAIKQSHGMDKSEADAAGKAIAQKYLLRDQLDPSDPSLSYFSKILSEVGVLIEKGRKMPALGKPLSWVVPFLKTPINFGIQNIERSPLGWIRGSIDLESASKLTTGAIMTGIGAMFAYMGETIWTPPTDEKEKEWFYATKRKPFSVKIGEAWIPFWYLGKYSLAFGFPAAIKHYTQESKESLTDTQLEEIGKIATGVAHFVGSQTSAQSIGNFFSFMAGDIERDPVSQIGFMLGQAIPAQGLVRYINKGVDTIYRKPEGLWETFMKDVPGFSQDLPSRKTPFMEESKRDFFNMFLPYDIGITDEAYEEMYLWKNIESKQKYLRNKLKSLNKKMKEGDIKEKHFDEMIKIFEGMPKVYEKE